MAFATPAALMHPSESTGTLPGHPMRPLGLAAALAALLMAGGCSSLQSSDGLLSRITPHRIEVVQGNVVTREQADAVKLGMTRAQVRDLLGSPLVASAFHEDRWDYVFTIRRQGTEPQLRKVLVRFEGDRLAALDTGGDLPGEREFVASIDTGKPSRKTPALALTDAQLAALPARKPVGSAPAAPAPAPTDATAPVRSFPPLEPLR